MFTLEKIYEGNSVIPNLVYISSQITGYEFTTMNEAQCAVRVEGDAVKINHFQLFSLQCRIFNHKRPFHIHSRPSTYR